MAQLSFTKHTIYDSNSNSRIAKAIDFDRDGDIDIIRGGSDGLKFLRNDGSENFAANAFYGYSNANSQQPIAIGDLDLDGDYDVISGVSVKVIYYIMK